jgi:GNAT superfamily N-acetyltransferase
VSAAAIRELEELGLRAWPPAERLECEGWQLGFAGGFSKRANSVLPLDAPRDLEAALRRCEGEYAARGQKCIVKLTDAARPAGLDAALARRGYALVDPTSVQTKEIGACAGRADPEVRIDACPGAAWLEACASWGGFDARGLAELLERIRARRAFAWLPAAGGAPAALALGVLDHRELGIFEVMTAREARRRGLARRTLGALCAWGADRGARRAWLQVVAANTPARHLYAELGFRETYRYWYRVAP